ncbi:MAG: hypothetical protein P4K98_07600 [Bryobacteraceae bacterium]|nr:hypothetical protein [Bryobacteraceae bacterium]
MFCRHEWLAALICPVLLAGLAGTASAQPETMAWGNLTGIRIDGQLMELNSSMCVVQPGWAAVSRTGRERQQNTYARNGKVETVSINMRPPRELREQGVSWRLFGKQSVEETGAGSANVGVEYSFKEAADIEGAYYCFELPAERYSGGSVELIEPAAPGPERVSLAPGINDQNEYLRATVKGLRFVSPKRQLELTFNEPTAVIIRDDRRKNDFSIQVYLAVIQGKAAAGQTAKKSFTLKAAGEIDKSAVSIALDATRPGQKFDGLGGNFRIQNPRLDPQVIQYSLDTLRVAWGRVEMPWGLWQPTEEMDPLAEARAGKLNPRIAQAMEMAQKLARKGMPVIVSAWFPPSWAILGSRRGFGPRPPATPAPAGAAPARPVAAPADDEDAIRGNPLNPAKMDKIKESIASYLVFLKERYGVEAAMFTFNESDLGIDVRQTSREHADLIKTLGPHFALRGLATKLALGDTSDANPIDFIQPALHDPEAAKYVGAVDFHSWRGCTDEILARWRDAARTLNVPLIVAEGSTDAAAYRYPKILLEPSFALYEINLYLRILAIAQPASILQWQLTADYSPLAGGGIFGDNGPLRPTQRYWNLKQLASTPARSFALPVRCGAPELNCAAFGDIADGQYAVHIVNNGTGRPATLTGLPASVKELRVQVTDSRRGMEEGARIPVVDGRAQFTLDPMSYTTLSSAAGEGAKPPVATSK